MRREGPSLRPLTTPEALDAAILVLSRSWPRYLGISCAGTVPVAVLLLLYYHWVGTVTAGEEESYYWTGTLIWSGGMALAWMLLSVSRGALALAFLSDARALDEGPRPAGGTTTVPSAAGPAGGYPERDGALPASAPACWRAALREAPSLALVGALGTVASWVAAAAGIVGGLLPLSAWMAARPAVVDEQWRFVAAFERSSQLTRSYRGKAVRLWFTFLLIWAVALVNVYGLVELLLSAVNVFLGYDVSAWGAVLSARNPAYLLWLAAILFVFLDPLKTAAETAYYLDLRIRREGADLHERQRALSSLGALTVLLVLTLFPTTPAGAATLEEYRRDVGQLRARIAAARDRGDVDPSLAGTVLSGTVRLPDGQQVAVDNRWFPESLSRWTTETDRQSLLARLETLERALQPTEAQAPVAGAGGTSSAAATRDPRQAYQAAIARPEFQELADRPELRRLVSGLRPERARSWFQRLGDWIQKNLLRARAPRTPDVQTPSFNYNPATGRRVLIALLILAGAILLAVIVRAFFLRWQERPAAKATAAIPPPLEESQTENALDHTADQWEVFAAEWLKRGDLRQAVRALYLALLVDLHQQRLIDYNRALTNWHYVRNFAGETDQRNVMRQLTERFDLSWYGRLACSPEQFRLFEQGVRALVKARPVGGVVHA